MTAPPRVSIVTTVYDRTDCLKRCLRSIERSTYQDLEHLVVSDAPAAVVVDTITGLVEESQSGKVQYINLPTRANDWGMTPAGAGLRAARGEFICFLSDDNAYLPDHLGPLVAALDANPDLGFAYSSCLYNARTILRTAPPAAGRIDLGQPLFRRQVLAAAFSSGLPFHEFAWDWRMIATLLASGARWRHLDVATFVFRLAAYPNLVRTLA